MPTLRSTNSLIFLCSCRSVLPNFVKATVTLCVPPESAFIAFFSPGPLSVTTPASEVLIVTTTPRRVILILLTLTDAVASSACVSSSGFLFRLSALPALLLRLSFSLVLLLQQVFWTQEDIPFPPPVRRLFRKMSALPTSTRQTMRILPWDMRREGSRPIRDGWFLPQPGFLLSGGPVFLIDASLAPGTVSIKGTSKDRSLPVIVPFAVTSTIDGWCPAMNIRRRAADA